MTGLTEQQSRCINFIRSYTAERGYAPTYVDIMRGLGLASRSGVHRLVLALEARGKIRRMPRAGRSVSPIEQQPEHTFAVSFAPEVYAAVGRYARRTRTSPEAVIREAVHAYVLGHIR